MAYVSNMSSGVMPIIRKVVVPEGADLIPTINKVGGLEESDSALLCAYNCHRGLQNTRELPCNAGVWCGVGAACGAVSRFGACVPRAPGALANRPKIRSFEGTECPRIFFSGVFGPEGPEVPRASRALQNCTKNNFSEGTECPRFFFLVFLGLKIRGIPTSLTMV